VVENLELHVEHLYFTFHYCNTSKTKAMNTHWRLCFPLMHCLPKNATIIAPKAAMVGSIAEPILMESGSRRQISHTPQPRNAAAAVFLGDGRRASLARLRFVSRNNNGSSFCIGAGAARADALFKTKKRSI